MRPGAAKTGAAAENGEDTAAVAAAAAAAAIAAARAARSAARAEQRAEQAATCNNNDAGDDAATPPTPSPDESFVGTGAEDAAGAAGGVMGHAKLSGMSVAALPPPKTRADSTKRAAKTSAVSADASAASVTGSAAASAASSAASAESGVPTPSGKPARYRVAIKFKIGEGWRGTKSRDFPGRHFLLDERELLFEWADEFRRGAYLYAEAAPNGNGSDGAGAVGGVGGVGGVAGQGQSQLESGNTQQQAKQGGSPKSKIQAKTQEKNADCGQASGQGLSYVKDQRVVPLPPGQSGFKRRKPFVGITEVHRKDAFLWFRETFQRLLSSVA